MISPSSTALHDCQLSNEQQQEANSMVSAPSPSQLKPAAVGKGWPEGQDEAAAPRPKAPGGTPRPKQPSLATLMMLKKRIGDIRARQRRNRPVKKMENTYCLEPDAEKKFPPAEVKQIVNNSLKFFLGESKYDQKASPKLAKMVSEDVKRRMKNNYNCPRYKIIVQVTIAQKSEQILLLASRSVTDSATDDFVTGSLERPTFRASATAFWIYCE